MFLLYMEPAQAFKLIETLKTKESWEIQDHDTAACIVKDEADRLAWIEQRSAFESQIELQYSQYCDREALLIA